MRIHSSRHHLGCCRREPWQMSLRSAIIGGLAVAGLFSGGAPAQETAKPAAATVPLVVALRVRNEVVHLLGPLWLEIVAENIGKEPVVIPNMRLCREPCLHLWLTPPGGRQVEITSLGRDILDRKSRESQLFEVRLQPGEKATYVVTFAAAILGHAERFQFVLAATGEYGLRIEMEGLVGQRTRFTAAGSTQVKVVIPDSIKTAVARLQRWEQAPEICSRSDRLSAEAKAEAALILKTMPGTVWAEMAQITLARVAIVENPETVSLEQLLGYLNTFWKGHRAAVHQLIGLWRGKQAGEGNGRLIARDAYIEQIAPEFGDTEEIIHLRNLH